MDHVVQPQRTAAQNLVADTKTGVLHRVIVDETGHRPTAILVVGCGAGREAAILSRAFGADVTGIDLGGRFDPEAAAVADLRVMSAEAMEFDSASFDMIYSFHALEHFARPDTALAEMQRVLAPDGVFFIGTPNKRRLVGYVGSPTRTLNKIRWNAHDYWMRLTGRFHNEDGAHAGFTIEDLMRRCIRTFGEARDVTDAYYAQLYARHEGKLRVTRDTGIARFLYPCIYVLGRNRRATPA